MFIYAAKGLADMGEDGTAALIGVMNCREKYDLPVEVQRVATRILVERRDPRLAPLFLDMYLERIQWDGKTELARRGLVDTGAPAVQVVADAFLEASHSDRDRLMELLVAFGHVAVPFLQSASDQIGWENRVAIAKCLGRIDSPTASDAILTGYAARTVSFRHAVRLLSELWPFGDQHLANLAAQAAPDSTRVFARALRRADAKRKRIGGGYGTMICYENGRRTREDGTVLVEICHFCGKQLRSPKARMCRFCKRLQASP